MVNSSSVSYEEEDTCVSYEERVVNSSRARFTSTLGAVHCQGPGKATEVGPPERTRQTVREGLNDVWVRGRLASDRLY